MTPITARTSNVSTERKTISAADIAQKNHETVVAQRNSFAVQVEAMRNSTTWRIGQLFTSPLRLCLDLMPSRKLRLRCTGEITSKWPALIGHISVGNEYLFPAELTLKIGDRLYQERELEIERSERVKEKHTTVYDFSLGYPTNNGSFKLDEVEVLLDGKKLASSTFDGDELRTVSPIEIIQESILRIYGDLDSLKTRVQGGAPIALVSTFRPTNRSERALQFLLEKLRNAGFALMVIDTSDQPLSELNEADVVLHRRNIGWDFASWLACLASYSWIEETASRVLLINDSNYGPIGNFSYFLETHKPEDADVWGITDSEQISDHIQSYFLMFENSALKSKVLTTFSETYAFPLQKQDVIKSGEVGISKLINALDLRLRSVFPVVRLRQEFEDSFQARFEAVTAIGFHKILSDLGSAHLIPELQEMIVTGLLGRSSESLNPTHRYWDCLLKLGSPFVKRELILANPEGLKSVREFRRHITDPEILSIIDSELEDSISNF